MGGAGVHCRGCWAGAGRQRCEMRPRRAVWVGAAVVVAGAVGGGCTVLLGADEDYYLAEEAECTPGELGCEGNAPLNCLDDGTWQVLAECAGQTCVDGSCRGVCGPGQRQCAGNTPQECGGSGQWGSLTECAGQTCVGGECVGECVAGEVRCSGNTPQECDGAGQWQGGASCMDGGEVCQAAACIPPPSCAGLGATCGPSGGEDCCAWGAVDGGTFNRSNDPAYPASVSDFVLDRFEITVGRFRKFVAAYPGSKPAAGAGAHPLIAGSGWDAAWDASLPADRVALIAAVKCSSTSQTWTDAPGANENLPMNCITWYAAFAFCAWDGGRLPTEAEWNYAAAGGREQREYPWSVPASSTTIDGTYAIYHCLGDGSAAGSCAFSDIGVVGSRSPKGDGLWGQADLAGSMWEWTLDRHGNYPNPCNDCADEQSASYRVVRGGGWYYGASSLLSASRYFFGPSGRDSDIGARCARTP